MRRSIIAAAALLITAIGVWFWAAQSTRQSRLALAALSRQRLTMEAAIPREETRAFAAQQQLGDLQRAMPLPMPTAISPPATEKKVAEPRLPASQRELISSDPKLEVLSLRWQRAVIGLEYGPFFRARGLSLEQIRQFEENNARYTEQTMDVAAIAQKQDESGKTTAAALQQQAKEAYEAAQIELLGTEGFRQMEEYIRTLVPRNVIVLGLAGAAAFEGIPLTAQQGDQLWQAAIKAGRNGPLAKGPELVEAMDWDAFDHQARQILSPAQFELFKNVAPSIGFGSPAELKSKAAIRRAREAGANARSIPVPKSSGG